MKKCPLKAGEFFLLRTPLLPTASGWSSAHSGAVGPSSPDPVIAALESEAIFLSSENLFEQAAAGETVDDRLTVALARYRRRMATRCTPFGMSAGVTLGSFGDRTSITIPSAAGFRRVCRLDQGQLQKLVEQARRGLEPEQVGHSTLELNLNSSLWAAPDGYRLVEIVDERGLRRHRLSRVRRSPGVDAAVKLFGDGRKLRFVDASETLSKTLNCTKADADQFLLQLVDNQILVPEPQLAANSDDLVAKLLEVMEFQPWAARQRDLLQQTADALLHVGADPARNVEVYRQLSDRFEADGVAHDAARLIHVDLHKDSPSASIASRTIQDIVGAVWSAAPLLVRRNPVLQGFINEFTARYGDAEAPLMEVLDEDIGIGFGGAGEHNAPLIAPLAGPAATAAAGPVAMSPTDLQLLKLVIECAAGGGSEIDVKGLAESVGAADPVSFPDSVSIIGTFHAVSPAAFEAGDLIFEPRLFHSPAMALFGRFCCGSPDLAKRVRDYVQAHEADDSQTIFAEVAHLPYGRVGNVVVRPPIRRFEITYMSATERPAEFEIPARELTIRVVDNRILLFWPRRGLWVTPRLSTAHNYEGPANLPIYRFLGALQTQDQPAVGWVWSQALAQLPHLPRVRCGKLLLSRARWTLDRNAAQAHLHNLPAFLVDRGIPCRFSVRAADNFLEFDLSREGDLDLFKDELRRSESLLLEEAFDDEDLILDEAGRGYRQEILFPVANPEGARQKAEAMARRLATSGAPPSRRGAAVPGGEWLYTQVFAGPETVDQLVCDVFPRFQDAASLLGCERAFFIRYNENGMHIRMRAHGPRDVVWGPLRQSLEAQLSTYVDGGSIYRIRYDSYFPEYARYGGTEAMPLYEVLFSQDSATAAAAVKLIRAAPNPADYRWRFAFLSMLGLLRDLVEDPKAQAQLAGRMARAYAHEFGGGKREAGILKDIFRDLRPFFDGAVLGERYEDDRLNQLSQLVSERSLSLKPVARQILNLQDRAAMLRSVESVLHMCANRIFVENARRHELVICTAMEKSLLSCAAREKYQVGQV